MACEFEAMPQDAKLLGLMEMQTLQMISLSSKRKVRKLAGSDAFLASIGNLCVCTCGTGKKRDIKP